MRKTRFRWFYFRLILLEHDHLSNDFSFRLRWERRHIVAAIVAFSTFLLETKRKNSNIQNISLSFQCTLAQFSLYIFWKRARAPFEHTANALYKMAFVFLIHTQTHTQIPVLIEIQTLIGQLKSHGKVCKISIYRKMKSEIQSLRSQHIEHGAIHNRQFFFVLARSLTCFHFDFIREMYARIVYFFSPSSSFHLINYKSY